MVAWFMAWGLKNDFISRSFFAREQEDSRSRHVCSEVEVSLSK